jgi:hypothetical protein
MVGVVMSKTTYYVHEQDYSRSITNYTQRYKEISFTEEWLDLLALHTFEERWYLCAPNVYGIDFKVLVLL